MTPAQFLRRQNTSCDPCRRSKRRCFFSSSTNGATGATCANCKRLGRPCTFEFVALKSSSLERRRQYPSPQWDGLTDESLAAVEELSPWLNMDAGHSHIMGNIDSNGPGNTEFMGLPISSPSHVEAISRDQNESQLPPLSPSCFDLVQAPFQHDTRYIVGSSLSSPIYLLNTKLDATILDKRLVHIHNTIVTGCASRFMDYDCNLYAKQPGYQLECEDSVGIYIKTPVQPTAIRNNISSEPIVSSSESNNDTSMPSQEFGQPEAEKRRMGPHAPAPNDAGYQMTVFGVIRFLDHFSDLYGNRLSIPARRQSDTVLKAVLRVFSMQWLSILETVPTSQGDATRQSATYDPLTSAFYGAWFEARSLIQKTQHIRSFRVIYAVLLFDGISIPTKTAESIVAHEFLDLCLENLCYLDDLVKKYCATLGSQSIYSSRLEASLSVARWGGYIRDIGASFMTNRQCKLPCAASHGTSMELAKDQTSSSFYDSICYRLDKSDTNHDLDDNIPHICRKAVAEAFSVWRQIVEVKTLVSQPTQPPGLWDTIFPAVTAVGKFKHLFGSFLNYCMENLEHLPIHSKASSVSIVIFWNFAVLIFTDSVMAAVNSPHYIELDLISTIHTYQTEAISSIARTVDRVLSIPTEEGFNLQNGLCAEVPIIAYHITPVLTAATFEKAIETIISIQLTPLYGGDVQQDPSLNTSTEHVWKQQVDIIMKGIISLTATVGGSEAANTVSQSLLRRHGDTLSECWSSDFST